MDSKKVYVITACDVEDFKVKSQLIEEGYKFCFSFRGPSEALLESDEVWIFGDCSNDPVYRTAVDLGKDIWEMG